MLERNLYRSLAFIVVLFLFSCETVSREELELEYFGIARDYSEDGNYERAQQYFTKAEELAASQKEEAMYNVAVTALINEDLIVAEDRIERLLRINSENLLAEELKAWLLYKKGFYIASLRLYVDVRNRGADQDRMKENAALLYSNLSDSSSTINLYGETAVLAKAGVLQLLADAHKKLGDLSEATLLYSTYVDLIEDNEEEFLPVIQYYNDIGDYERLLAIYEKLIEINELDTNYLFEIAYIQLVQGIDFQAGLDNLRKAFIAGYGDKQRIDQLLAVDLFDPDSVVTLVREFEFDTAD